MSAAFVFDCSVAMAWLFHDEATPKTAALLALARGRKAPCGGPPCIACLGRTRVAYMQRLDELFSVGGAC